jgi:hypothetical protein
MEREAITKALQKIDLELQDQHYEPFYIYALWMLYGKTPSPEELQLVEYQWNQSHKFFKYLVKLMKEDIKV